jgi:hypothetical protein
MDTGLAITSEWSECPACHYVFDSRELFRTSTPCPSCGATGTRWMFPESPSADLIHMASYFFLRGEDRKRANQQAGIQEALAEVAGQNRPEHLEAVIAELERRFQASNDPFLDDTMYEESLTYLKSQLGISSEQAIKVWHSLMASTRSTFEEHKAVVLMACSAFEIMLKGLLEHLGFWSGLDPEKVDDIIEEIRNPREPFTLFKKWAGREFDDAVNALGCSDFLTEWNEIRMVRNDFMHGEADAITRSAAVSAIDLLPNLIRLFADLQNHFAPKPQG